MKKNRIDQLDLLYSSSIDSYSQILEYFSNRTDGKKAPNLKVVPATLGNKNLYATFSTAAVPDLKARRLTEWNPLSQRPSLHLLASLNENTPTDIRFTEVKNVVDAFVINTHEMMHILPWEPFFVGKMEIRNQNDFFRYTFLAEGFCFFHTDVLVTPMIKARFPDGELMYKRRTISGIDFNPYSAFKELGLEEKIKILELYLLAFTGQSTALLDLPNKARTTSLAMRIYSFYAANSHGVGTIYKVLKSFGVFTEYQKRFCRGEELPKLLPTSILNLANRGNGREFFLKVFESGLNHIDKLSHSDLELVKLRRSIQTRAYFAFQIKHIIKKNLFAGGMISPAQAAKVSENIHTYLASLENCLELLQSKKSISEITTALVSADKFYELKIREVFKKNNLWVADRPHVIVFKKGFCDIGLSKAHKTVLQSESAIKVLLFLAARHQDSVNSAVSPQQKLKVALAIKDILSLEIKLIKNPGRMNKKLCREFADLLESPVHIDLWSAKLADVDPLNNKFVELLFVYE